MKTGILSTGDKILNTMKEMDMSIPGLAALSGVRENTLLDIMAGIREADIGTLCRIADALGVCVRELCPDQEQYTIPVEKNTLARDIALWLADIAADGTEPEERKRALELLKRLAEYKPLAKIEEIEEQNYNMVDNVLNNGAGEKAQKEENKKEQERPAAKVSLKARLAEKKAIISDQGKDHEVQENIKNSQREM